MSDEDGKAVLDSYREHFRPSTLLAEPSTIVAVGVVCAASEAEALAASAAGVRAAFGAQAAGAGTGPAAANPRKHIAGTPERVGRQLIELQKHYGADELLLVTMTGTYEQRLQSFRLLAEHAIMKGST